MSAAPDFGNVDEGLEAREAICCQPETARALLADEPASARPRPFSLLCHGAKQAENARYLLDRASS